MTHQWTPLQTSRHHDSLRRELGEAITLALANPDITEVMLNPDGRRSPATAAFPRPLPCITHQRS